MLGLRNSFPGHRLHNNFSAKSHSLNPDDIDDDDMAEISSRGAMDGIRIGHQESMYGWSDKFQTSAEHISSPESMSSASDSEKTRSASEDAYSMTTLSRRSTRAYSFQANGIKDVYMDIRHNLRMLDEYTYTDKHFEQLSYESYRNFVANERLVRMPRRGSFGDRALRAAQIFGENLWNFGVAIEHFCPDTRAASVTGLASCQILLEIDNNHKALVPTFHALNELALLVSQLIQIEDIFKQESSSQARYSTVELYSHLIRLIGDIAIYYTKKIDSLSGDSVNVNFDSIFGDQMANIGGLRDKIVGDIWKGKLGHKSEGLTSVRRSLKDDLPAEPSFRDQITESMRRAEDTCEWFKSHLAEFLRGTDKVFTITGPVGSGKTVLAHWITERLQRPLDHERYSTLHHTFPFDSPKDATTLSFLKSTLSQLLERNVGDVHLYEKLVTAFTGFDESKDTRKLESGLWTALEAGLSTAADRGHPLVLVVDGFDEITDVSPSVFHKTLREHIGKQNTTRAITLSGPAPHITDGSKHLNLTRDLLVEDIRAFLWQRLSGLKTFMALSEYLRDRAVEDLTQKAEGSFLWATSTSDLLAKQTSVELLSKTVQALRPGLDGVLQKLIATLPLKTEPTHRLLTFMLVAERPLATAELSELLQVDIKKRELGNAIDSAKELSRNCTGIATVQDGRAHFKAKAIKGFMTNLMGKSLPSMEEGQRQITVSLLLYAKLSLVDSYEPSFEDPESELVDKYFQSYPLLEYAVTSWTHHFRSSIPSIDKDEISLTSEFKDIFPDSVLLAQLESSCWEKLPTEELISRHSLALNIRAACFQDKGLSTLQTLMNLGNIYYTYTPDAATAARFFYRAANLSQHILPRSSNVTVMCAVRFLQTTEAINFTERTELATWRIGMIEFMIEFSKTKYGSNSKAVLKWYQMLAELYVNINEEHNAAVTYKSIYEIIVVLEGKHSPRAKAVGERFRGMDIVLRGQGNKQDIKEVEDMLLETSESVHEGDTANIDTRLHLVSLYMSHQQWAQAEETLIVLWQHISEACRVKANYKLRMSQLQVATEYAKLLRRMKRDDEAVGILTCVWVEYENQTFEDTAMTLHIKEIGELFRTFGILDVALTVFSKVWTWFKSKGKTTHKEAVKTTTLITEVADEITTTTTTTIVTTESTLAVLRETYEIHYTRCKGSQVDAAFFKSFSSLVKVYLNLENWAQAETVIKQALVLTWKAVLSGEATLRPSQQFTNETLTAATYLGLCYQRQGKVKDAEEIYLRVFRVCLSSFNPEDKRVQDSLVNVVGFYTEQNRQDKIIDVYKELLDKYRKHLGASHKSTIELLYTLASKCRGLNRKEEYTYYAEIVTALSKSKKYCHPDAQKAALMLIDHYYEEQSWSELQHICSLLWQSFVNHHEECRFEEHQIELLYSRYSHVLQSHANVDYSALYKLAQEYYSTSSTVFGSSSSIVRKAMFSYAEVCERDEKHYQESVSAYEDLIKWMSTTQLETTAVKETEIATMKTRLSTVYFRLITSGTQISTTSVERAITLFLEAHTQLVARLGFWHESTLAKLRETVLLYQKLDSNRSRANISQLLQTSFMGILTSSVTSVQLFTAASTLASIYVSAGLVEEAKDLTIQVQHLIVLGDSFDSAGITLKPEATIGKGGFAFLTAFAQNLSQDATWTHSESMALRLVEMSLYEQYARAIAEEEETAGDDAARTGIRKVLERGGRLRALWHDPKMGDHTSLVRALDQRMFQLFKAKYGKQLVGAEDNAARELYLALVVGLGRTQSKVEISELSCRAGNERVVQLLEKGDFKRANQVARCVFNFGNKQGFYHDIHNLQYGYRLAEYMAGIDVRAPTDSKLRDEMAKTSREITSTVMEIFRAEGIEFVRLKFKDIAAIVRLLGAQHDYKDLEHILLELWHSREVRDWDPSRVLSIGRLLVHAHQANHNLAAAISMCDRLRYNLHRSKGRLDPASLFASELLAALYTTGDPARPAETKRPDRAMAIYEEVLREVDAACAHQHRRPGDAESKALAATATRYLDLLRRAHLRMGGGWTKDRREFEELHGRLASRLGLRVQGPDAWAAEGRSGQQVDALGTYEPPKEWRLDEGLFGEEVRAK